MEKTVCSPDKWMLDEARRHRRVREEERNLKFLKQLGFAFLAIIFCVFLTILYFEVPTVEPAHADEGVTMPVPEPYNPLTIKATVTAYTSSVDETDDRPNETANGDTAGRGSLACPSKYPFGTQVEIAGKTYTCNDRMNKRYRSKEHFDVWMPSKAQALRWGVRKVEVTILDV